MDKNFEIEFIINGENCGSGTIMFRDGNFDISDAEEMFYKTLRRNEAFLKQEAIEEYKSKIIDGLTHEQEEILKEEHAKDYSGQDDDMIDDYENWLLGIDIDYLVKLLKLEYK